MFVPGIGPKSARIVLIGEAPGAEEDKVGKPFVGPAGRFLNILLRKAGIDREECYITNVVKERPPKNDISKVDVQSWYPSLYEELNGLPEARVFVCLGDTAMKALTGDKGVTKWRGSVLSSPFLKRPHFLIGTYHPSRVMQYDYKMHPAIISDLIKVRKVAESGWHPIERTFITNPTREEAIEFIRKCKERGLFAYDFETVKKTNELLRVGLAISEAEAMSIPSELGVWDELRDLFRSEAMKVSHNGGGFDDIVVKESLGVNVWLPKFDTYLAHALAHPELPHTLEFLGSMYTDMNYWKEEADEDLGLYNCKDVAATFESAQKLREELKREGMYELFVGYVQPLYWCLCEMSCVGLRVDLALAEELARSLEDDARRALSKLPEGVNPASPKQIAKLLYEDLGLPVQKNGKTKRVTVNEEALEELAKVKEVPELKAILEFRRAMKLKGTYLTKTALGDGRILTTYGAAETGRQTSKKRFDGKGMNVQNIPPEIRKIVVAEDGWSIVEADLAQAEVRAVAYLSGCKAMIDELNSPGGDVFRLVGSWVLGKKKEEITKEERKMMKAVVHGSNYLMGERTFAEYVGVNKEEAKRIQGMYFRRFPEVKLWHVATEQELGKGVLATPFGRKRRFLGLPGRETLKEAVAYRPQSIVVDYLNQCLVKLFLWLRGKEWAEVWSQNHDAVLLHVRDDKVDEVIKKIFEFGKKDLLVNGRKALFPLEVKVGKSWGNMKEVK